MSKSENLAARLHVDLRRQASAICSAGRRTR
ncbi:putative leader peptide [Streptomyces sp. NPDC050704]